MVGRQRRRTPAAAGQVRPGLIAVLAIAAFLLGNLLDGPGATPTVAADDVRVEAVAAPPQKPVDASARPKRRVDARLTGKVRALLDSALEDGLRPSRFVDDLGGTGYTDMFRDGEDRPIGGFVVLDAAVLRKFTANAWATISPSPSRTMCTPCS